MPGLGDQQLGRPFVVWVLGRLLTAFAALAGLEPAAGGTWAVLVGLGRALVG